MNIRKHVLLAMLALAVPMSAQAGDSLADILAAKGVITKEEAKQANKEAKSHVKLGGRLYVDSSWADNDNGTQLTSGSEFRAARLHAVGSFGDWHFKGQYDFADNKTKIKDVYLKYTGFNPVYVKAGHFKEPFSIEELTSSRFITFTERALPNALAPGRHMGLAVGGHGDMFTVAAGIFGASPNNSNDSNADFTGRVTFSPFHSKTEVLHLGAAVKYSQPGDVNVAFAKKPETHYTANGDLVDTGTLANVDDSLTWNAEVAGVYGPFSIQAEYMATNVSFDTAGRSDEDFSGYYVLGSWFLTGESRHYSFKKGAFARVHPNHDFGDNGFGAVELAVRYSHLDLADGLTSGGEEDNWTVGINWYVHPHVRFMANYVSIDADPTASAATPANTRNVKPSVVNIRAQVDF